MAHTASDSCAHAATSAPATPAGHNRPAQRLATMGRRPDPWIQLIFAGLQRPYPLNPHLAKARDLHRKQVLSKKNLLRMKGKSTPVQTVGIPQCSGQPGQRGAERWRAEPTRRGDTRAAQEASGQKEPLNPPILSATADDQGMKSSLPTGEKLAGRLSVQDF